MGIHDKLINMSIEDGFKGKVANKILDVAYFFINLNTKALRALQWAIVGWRTPDYAGDFTLKIINVHLHRMDKYFQEDGYSLWNTYKDDTHEKFNNLLQLSDKVVSRELPEIMALYEEHEKKWGELKHWFTPSERGPGLRRFHSKYANTNTEEEQELADKEMMEIRQKEMDLREQNLNDFCDALKNIEDYWD